MSQIRFFYLFILLASSQLCLTQQWPYKPMPFIENYDAEQYHAGIQNWDITQSEDGRLYVANNLGLLEFDGSKWENHQIKYGTKLRSLLVREDVIYAGSQNDFGFFTPNESGQLAYVSLADSLSIDVRGFDETWKIYNENDKIYFCTFNSIFEYDKGQTKVIPSAYRLEISFLVEHNLLVQEWGHGLSILKNDSLQLLPGGDFFKDKRISAILPYSKSQWLITTFDQGIFIYSNGTVNTKKLESLPDDLIINSATQLNDGTLAIGTQTNGVYIIGPSFQININRQNGLMDNTINSLYEDSHGSLWLSLNNGISRLDLSSPLSILDERSGILGAGYAALRINEQSYLGTNNGAYLLADNIVTPIPGTEGQVYEIQEMAGDIYISHHRGLMRVVDGTAQLTSDEKGAWKLIRIPNNPDLALLGTYNGLRVFDLKQKKIIKTLNGFGESSRVMAFEGETLWVTQGYKGAYQINLDLKNLEIINAELYGANKGFPSDFLINVFKIDGQLIFTAESGFFTYDNASDQFIPEETFNELIGADASIVDMDEDPLGNIYFIERDYIGAMQPTVAGAYELNTSSFGLAKSFWNDDLGNISVLNNNELFIGAREGFVLYDRSQDKLKRTPLTVSFDELSILGMEDSVFYSGHGATAISDIVFPYRSNSLGFNFFAPDFKSGNQTEFQFFLENYNEDWSEWSATTYKEFTNLKEGEYAFHVRAKNIFDQESEISTFTFKIKPPIYRTTGAYLFYSAGTLFLFFFGFKTLDYRYKEKTSALEKAKNTEIEEKEERIKEIAERSEKTIDDLKSQKLEAELKLKSQDLTSSAMHLIQKNELLTQVKQTLKGLDKNNIDNEAKSKLRSLVKDIDKDLASGEEWAQFESNFDQVHGNFITRLKKAYPKLTPQEIKFSAYIRMNLNTKEIANLLNISVRGVEIGRYRVRKKLELERKDNLSDFLLRF